MDDTTDTEWPGGIDALTAEAERYLSTVEAFRTQGCEPTWRPEVPSELVVRVRAWIEPCEQGVSGK